ncbi:MAG: hypothetical protein JWQ90_3748 [Hydrocarboniphaga sp.]|uniref:DUF3237 domain-containing protein n=1 Tax=Hydrocarboniphaga sp. TaxID=2033016 RepID=UPI002612A7C0|nr:DUF3237 domain-containing protein [Hydrocarboniphaga sp.]MDB5971298.1 hypothetical protein [Hydrocarboniphaga sp.]
MLAYQLEHICSYRAQLNPPQVIGPLPGGIRVNFTILGGEITGPRIRGELMPVGADFFNLRSDGVGILDVRACIRTHDGALIDVAYQGVGDLGEDGHARFLRGELPPKLQLRTAPRMTTAHPGYLWVNRLQCFGVGYVDMQSFEVFYDVHALR